MHNLCTLGLAPIMSCLTSSTVFNIACRLAVRFGQNSCKANDADMLYTQDCILMSKYEIDALPLTVMHDAAGL